MATFIIKNSSGSSRIDSATVTGSSLVFGSREEVETKRAENILGIRDGALAPQHCVVRVKEDGAFWVEEVGARSTASGTFLGETLVERPTQLTDGSILTLGNSRFQVSIDSEKREITFDYGFFQTDYSRDPIKWTQAETKLGRYAPVRWGNRLTLLAIVAGLIYLWARDDSRDILLSPGPLRHDARIAQLLARYGGVSGAPRRLREAARHFAEAGCDACHLSAGEKVAFATCTSAGCHDDLDAADIHPRGNWRGREQRPLQKGIVAAYTCTDCHVEHRDRITPLVKETTDSCVECHGETPQFELIVETYRKQIDREPRPAMMQTVSLTYNSFSHGSHAKVDCAACHERPEVEFTGARKAHSDFKSVTFERCMGCHGPDRGPEIAADTAVYPAAWHGALEDDGANCLRCHSVLYAKESKQVSSPVPVRPRLFDVTSRPHTHADFLTARWENQRCTDCHLRGVELAGGRLLERTPFPHELHVPDLAGGPSRDCIDCHAGIARADTLTPARIFDRERCSESCHVDEEQPGRPLVSLVEPATADVTRVDFPHDKHRDSSKESLKDGCGSCHVFEGDDLRAPVTLQGAKNCSSCHDAAHKTIGGGSCHFCHPAGDAASLASVYENRTVEWRREGSDGFDHYSSGHAEETARDCSACHRAMVDSLDRVDTITAVTLPTDSDGVCVNCHVGSRFHMPLSRRFEPGGE